MSSQENEIEPEIKAKIECARQDTARIRGVELARVKMQSCSKAVFRNGCLDAAEEGEMCTEALAKGYKIVINVEGGAEIVYHANIRQLRRVEGEHRGKRIPCN
ncbi:MAG: hypothetical protein JNN15_19230 [Blastocatellia bacterium]|nr:hypothetical protein [Blastocatellia bacterium]